MNNFEATSSFLLPHDPVTAQRHNKRSLDTNISEAHFEEPDDEPNKKACVSKSGVELCFHTGREYFKLTDEQKAELNDHRDAREAKGLSQNLPKTKGKEKTGSNKKKLFGNKKKSMKAMIAAALAAERKKETKKAGEVASVQQEFKSYVQDLVLNATGTKKPTTKKDTISEAEASTPSEADSKPPALNLVSILGRCNLKK